AVRFQRPFQGVQAQQRQGSALHGATDVADAAPVAGNFATRFQHALEAHRQQALLHQAAVLGSGRQFLTEIAAFLPVDAAEFVKAVLDRKSTRLNSSHVKNSYAVFCLKKKKNTK